MWLKKESINIKSQFNKMTSKSDRKRPDFLFFPLSGVYLLYKTIPQRL